MSIGYCTQCGAYNVCGCSACVGRHGVTGKEDIATKDGEGVMCWNCRRIYSGDELLDIQFEEWRLGQTLGVYQREEELLCNTK